jgi:hypothetical protein
LIVVVGMNMLRSGFVGRMDLAVTVPPPVQSGLLPADKQQTGPAHFPGFSRRGKVLRYRFDWRYSCAMLVGYAQVSTH